MMRSSRDAEEKGREVRSTMVSTWARGMTGAVVHAPGEVPGPPALAPNRSTRTALGHGGHVPQVWSPNRCRATFRSAETGSRSTG